MSDPLLDVLGTVGKVLETIVEDVGIGPIVDLITARTSEEEAHALLEAAYKQRRARSDAQARKEIGGP